MKLRIGLQGFLMGSLLCLASTQVSASSFHLTPDDSQVASAHNQARVALRFDLEELDIPTTEGTHHIFLEWTISGVPSNTRSEFALYSANEAWSSTNDVQELSLGEVPLKTWDIEVRDYERTGGFVRFDVTNLVNVWISGEANNGFIIVTSDVSSATLSGQPENVKLVVR